MEIILDKAWKKALATELSAGYFQQLKDFLAVEKKQTTVYPNETHIFSAFNHTPFEQIKVVIIGQDPYHGAGQANGLCFSVSPGIRKPPSLHTIFKEIQLDLGIPIPESGNLEPWAKQGVFLLNTSLTVRANTAGSHQKKGWELFTDAVIKKISDQKKNVIFLLWGKTALKKEGLIDQQKHLILKAAHPSPLARGAFFGCNHFSKTNEALRKTGQKEINWKVE